MIVDLRGMPNILSPQKGRSRSARPPWNSPAHLGADAAILVHQTGTAKIGAAGSWVTNYGERAREHRMRSWPYHVVAFADGVVCYAHPVERYTFHAGVANRYSVGVAIEGLYPRFERERDESRHASLTDEAIGAGRLAIAAAWGMLAEAGVERVATITHRQTSRQRGADPGELIMRRIVQPIAAELGVPVAADFTDGDGRPLPEEWR